MHIYIYKHYKSTISNLKATSRSFLSLLLRFCRSCSWGRRQSVAGNWMMGSLMKNGGNHLCIHTCACVYIYIYHKNIHMHMCVCVRACVSAYTYAEIDRYIYIYIRTHIYIYISWIINYIHLYATQIHIHSWICMCTTCVIDTWSCSIGFSTLQFHLASDGRSPEIQSKPDGQQDGRAFSSFFWLPWDAPGSSTRRRKTEMEIHGKCPFWKDEQPDGTWEMMVNNYNGD